MFIPVYFVDETLRENQCPKCKHKLVLINADTTLYEIQSDGKIGDSMVKSNFYLYCPFCGHKIDRFEKRGMYVKRDRVKLENDNPFYM